MSEKEQDVEEDEEQSQGHTDDGAVGDVLSHGRSYLGRADDGSARTDIRVLEGLYVGLADEASLVEGVVEDGLCAVVLHRVVGLNIVVGRDADGLAVRTEGDDGSRGLLASVRTRSVDECAIEQLAHALYLRGLVEGHDIVASTREVDTLAEAADGEAADEDHGGNATEGGDERRQGHQGGPGGRLQERLLCHLRLQPHLAHHGYHPARHGYGSDPWFRHHVDHRSVLLVLHRRLPDPHRL